MYNLVLKDMQELEAQAMKDANAFCQRLNSRMERRYLGLKLCTGKISFIG